SHKYSPLKIYFYFPQFNLYAIKKIVVQKAHQNNTQATKKGRPKIIGSMELASKIRGLSNITKPITGATIKKIRNPFLFKLIFLSVLNIKHGRSTDTKRYQTINENTWS